MLDLDFDEEFKYRLSPSKRTIKNIDEVQLREILQDDVAFNFFKFHQKNLVGNYLLTKPIMHKDDSTNFAEEDVQLHILLGFLFFSINPV